MSQVTATSTTIIETQGVPPGGSVTLSQEDATQVGQMLAEPGKNRALNTQNYPSGEVSVNRKLYGLSTAIDSRPISTHKQGINPVFKNLQRIHILEHINDLPESTLVGEIEFHKDLDAVGMLCLHKLAQRDISPKTLEIVETKLLSKGFELDLDQLRLLTKVLQKTDDSQFLEKIGKFLENSPKTDDLLSSEKLALKHLIEGHLALKGGDNAHARECFRNSIASNPTQEAALGLIKAGDTDLGKQCLYLTCLRDGGLTSGSPTARRYQIVYNFLNGATEEQLQKDFSQAFGELGEQETKEQLTLLQKDIKSLGGSLPEAVGVKDDQKRLSAYPEVGEQLFEALDQRTYKLRGVTHSIAGGNVGFGSDIAAMVTCERDREVASKILHTPIEKLFSTPPLGFDPKTTIAGQIQDQAMKLMDMYIREMYNTASLEDLKSEFHKTFDKGIKENKNAGGLSIDRPGLVTGGENSPIPFSQTNVLTNLASRVGDCRHHAQAKCLLFDQYQREQVDATIKEVVGGKMGFEAGDASIKGVLKEEMRIFDMSIIAPVQTNGMYEIEKNSQGIPLLDPEMKDHILEEHTMTVLINPEDKKVSMADSFYHEAYKLNEGLIGRSDTVAEKISWLKWKNEDKSWDKPEEHPAFNSDIKIRVYDSASASIREIPCKISTVRYSDAQLLRTRQLEGLSDTGNYFGVPQDQEEELAVLLDGKGGREVQKIGVLLDEVDKEKDKDKKVGFLWDDDGRRKDQPIN